MTFKYLYLYRVDSIYPHGQPYACDVNNQSYPWYSEESIITIEGPTNKHTLFTTDVSKFFKSMFILNKVLIRLDNGRNILF